MCNATECLMQGMMAHLYEQTKKHWRQIVLNNIEAGQLHLTGMIENAAGNEMENGKKFKVQSSEMGPWPAQREQSTKDV